jgi:hypothetical protein
MEINRNCKLFMTQVYLYDILQCHYTILKKLGFGLSGIDVDNKLERNKHIGLLMRDNPKLTSVLRDITNSTISEYLERNEVLNDDLIIRQYDGIITKRLLRETDRYIPIELRNVFEIFIISIDRNMYIARDKDEIVVKGVPYKYDEMNNYYKKILKINYLDKVMIFKTLQKIKDEILNSDDPMLFCIPSEENKFNVFLKKYGEVEISKPTARILNTDDIDKQKYFDFYIRPFTESLILEFI